MPRSRSPLALLTAIFAGWVNRHQRGVIDYLLEENRILRAKLGKSRLQFTDAERRRLARKGGPLGRRILEAIVSIVTPDTILAWHRERCHQGIGNVLIEPGPEAGTRIGTVKVRERLGGLLIYYYRRAG
jgi:hypothetical protein